ncbi:CRISPR-associated protein Csx1 [Caldicellulosiruptor bescii]|uniref:CRISPR-associated protein, MJ1666 family n=2 Tax=Caldicellulosiruptor bescii TaxID=31899 RepID=B9MPY5_CALBD|nr:CRISPR-associated CARF protein Csx1 [Caldicellulosiruptor bescii]ACM61768.1 CRISPR-associated protein, MJ1666 family [Caldicellulosiruptor bescii DSM 6725]PBC88432.1 CRISPR-associated protein Csx1 [Caldicellulosiruptor bescii]PBC92087.1 CRISPR-associated protein Csx1 [Caldicellulosiruptor bescii]PBD02497.1 CRISPR-associated protein Csx1 [Caldicellulosiruptor bescii]PBD05266.1 CRISPR-associated protein Csx1 [Caldicellulosiruptor bescii]
MKIIYQIGRLDNPKTAKRKFFITNKSQNGDEMIPKESELSSFVLKDFLEQQGHKVKTVVIYPVSILLNEKIKEYIEDDDLKEKLKSICENPLEYLKSPFDIINKLPLESLRDDTLVIHSLGTYLNNVELDGSYDDIVLEILFDMIERYIDDKKEENIDEIYLDISSGHNIYISAMIEASRHFAVLTKLMHWIHEERQPRIYLTFSDPITGRTAENYELHIQPQSYTAFFSSPISKKEACDHNFSFLRNIYQEPQDDKNGNNKVLQKKQIREKRKALKEKIEMFTILFSAIKNNVPLYLYYHPYHSIDEIKNELKNLINHAKDQLSKDFKSSPRLNKKAYLDAILSLCFYMGIVEVLEEYNITMFCQQTGFDLEKLGQTFAQIYTIFGIPMNWTMLGNEISNDTEKIQEHGEIEQWTRLRKIVDPGKPIYDEPDKRNFFAHSGLEGNITEVRYNGEKVYVRYIQVLPQSTIDCWLKERV